MLFRSDSSRFPYGALWVLFDAQSALLPQRAVQPFEIESSLQVDVRIWVPPNVEVMLALTGDSRVNVASDVAVPTAVDQAMHCGHVHHPPTTAASRFKTKPTTTRSTTTSTTTTTTTTAFPWSTTESLKGPNVLQRTVAPIDESLSLAPEVVPEAPWEPTDLVRTCDEQCVPWQGSFYRDTGSCRCTRHNQRDLYGSMCEIGRAHV